MVKLLLLWWWAGGGLMGSGVLRGIDNHNKGQYNYDNYLYIINCYSW